MIVRRRIVCDIMDVKGGRLWLHFDEARWINNGEKLLQDHKRYSSQNITVFSKVVNKHLHVRLFHSFIYFISWNKCSKYIPKTSHFLFSSLRICRKKKGLRERKERTKDKIKTRNWRRAFQLDARRERTSDWLFFERSWQYKLIPKFSLLYR